MSNDDLVDLVAVSHNVHGNDMKTGDFKKFLAQFPSWSYPVGWSASYRAYKF